MTIPTITLRDYIGAKDARLESEAARARRRDRIEERILTVFAFAPGAIVLCAFIAGFVKACANSGL